MKGYEYQSEALRTNSPNLEAIRNRLSNVEGGLDQKKIDLLHASLGMTTEAAEFADLVKKYLFYGKPFSTEDAISEAADQLWYIAVALEALGSSFEEAMDLNIKKLKKRYPDKFTESSAINRNVEEEVKVIENIMTKATSYGYSIDRSGL